MADRLTEKVGNMYCLNDQVIKKLKIDENKNDKEYIINKQGEIIMLLVKKLGPYEDYEKAKIINEENLRKTLSDNKLYEFISECYKNLEAYFRKGGK